MSWAEVRKINSDFANEPLNFNNYINDISTFKENSYVLDTQNAGLWRSLISQSLTLFGHRAIHDVVYNRLTDADVDYMLCNNGRLGESFNSFYRTNMFASGDINAVLKEITTSSYNVLELKIQAGINRYISDMTSNTTAGEWLGTVFGISALKSKTTMASILSDTALWNNTIMTNESLRYVICLSAATINWFSSTNSDAFLSFITEVANSTQATMDFLNALDATDKLTTFMSAENAVSIMASKKASMEAICYTIEPFAAMISSETAMNIVAASEIAIDVIIDGITNATNSEAVLSNIKGNLTSIEESLPSIVNTETVVAEILNVKESIISVIAALQKVNSQADILITNMDALITSETAMAAIISSESAISSCLNSSPVRNAFYNHANTIEPLLKNSEVALKVLRSGAQTVNCYVQGTLYGGKAFVLDVWDGATTTAVTGTTGQYIVGNASLSRNLNATHMAVNKFASSVTSGISQSSYGVQRNALIYKL